MVHRTVVLFAVCVVVLAVPAVSAAPDNTTVPPPVPSPAGSPPPRDPVTMKEPASRSMPETSRPSGAKDTSSEPVRIGNIDIEVVDVFDLSKPGEGRLFHRIVDLLHVQTQEQTIRRELLFEEGEPLDPALLAETERNLRKLRFVRSIEIWPDPAHDGVADVHVRVQDTWTTRVSYHLGRTGGHTKGALKANELNLFGLGKQLAFSLEKNQDRSRNTFEYEDSRLFGSELSFQAVHQISTDGAGDSFSLVRPFRSLGTHWSVGATASRNNESSRVYLDGENIASFDKSVESARIFYGWSKGVRDGTVHRYTLGWNVYRTGYTPQRVPHGGLAPELVPLDRTVSSPVFSYHRETEAWIKERNMVRVQRDEDFNLGSAFDIEAGLNGRAFGGTADELILSSSLSRGLRAGDDGIILLGWTLNGRWGRASDDEAVAGFDATWYDRSLSRQTLVGHVGVDQGYSLDGTSRLLLGGDEGLRGFNSRILDGSHRYIVNFEDRFWLKRELFHLFYVGAAGFADVGNAWDGPLSRGLQDIHADVGFGLRIDASRASQGGLFRLDFGFPVAGDKHGGPAIEFSFGKGLGF